MDADDIDRMRRRLPLRQQPGQQVHPAGLRRAIGQGISIAMRVALLLVVSAVAIPAPAPRLGRHDERAGIDRLDRAGGVDRHRRLFGGMQPDRVDVAVDVVPARGFVIHRVEAHPALGRRSEPRDQAAKPCLAVGEVDRMSRVAGIIADNRRTVGSDAVTRHRQPGGVAVRLRAVFCRRERRLLAATGRERRRPADHGDGQRGGGATGARRRHETRAILRGVVRGDRQAFEIPVAPCAARVCMPVVERCAVAARPVECQPEVARDRWRREAGAVDQRADRMPVRARIDHDMHHRGGGVAGRARPKRQRQRSRADQRSDSGDPADHANAPIRDRSLRIWSSR